MAVKRLIVGITGGSGVIYGVRLLEALKIAGVETHLIITKWGKVTLSMETDYSLTDVKQIASYYHDENNLAASISSGSFLHDGMIIAPCSMKTLGEIATGISNDLVSRAADVTLKENKKLLLLARETPMNLIHLRNATTVVEAGAIFYPPTPAFYNKPKTLNDVIHHTIGRLLDQFGIEIENMKRWKADQYRERSVYHE